MLDLLQSLLLGFKVKAAPRKMKNVEAPDLNGLLYRITAES